MNQADSDFWLGVRVLLVFIPAIFVLGYAVYRFKNARLARAWHPLIGLFERAQTAGDGGGAAASFLRGRYRGRLFDATMYPRISVYATSEDGEPRFNLFEIALRDVPGAQDWRIELHGHRMRDDAVAWSLTGATPALSQALDATSALALVSKLVVPDYTLAHNGPVLNYVADASRLVLRTDAREAYAPSADWVRRALDAMLDLAEINARINPPDQSRTRMSRRP